VLGHVCQIGFFETKFGKFGFFLRQLTSKKIVWLFHFNLRLFLESVGTYYQTGVFCFLNILVKSVIKPFETVSTWCIFSKVIWKSMIKE